MFWEPEESFKNMCTKLSKCPAFLIPFLGNKEIRDNRYLCLKKSNYTTCPDIQHPLANFQINKHRKCNNLMHIIKMTIETKVCNTQDHCDSKKQRIRYNSYSLKRNIAEATIKKKQGKYKIVIDYLYFPLQGRTSQQSHLSHKYLIFYKVLVSLYPNETQTHERNQTHFQDRHILLFSFLQDSKYFAKGWVGCWCWNDGIKAWIQLYLPASWEETTLCMRTGLVGGFFLTKNIFISTTHHLDAYLNSKVKLKQ